jgi:hypothetical protein
LARQKKWENGEKTMEKKFFSAILAATAFLFTAGFIGCSDDKGDDSPSVLLACNNSFYGFCEEYTKLGNEGIARDDCSDLGGTIVSKCQSEGVKLTCPFIEDGNESKAFVYDGLVWNAGREMYGISPRCSDIEDVLYVLMYGDDD